MFAWIKNWITPKSRSALAIRQMRDDLATFAYYEQIRNCRCDVCLAKREACAHGVAWLSWALGDAAGDEMDGIGEYVRSHTKEAESMAREAHSAQFN